MHLKAIIPLLVLSTLIIIIPSTALSVEWKDLPTSQYPDSNYPTTPITVGSYSLFASAWKPVYAFNADTRTATIFDWMISVDFAHTVVNNELLVFGGGNLVDNKLTIFDATSQQTSTIRLGFSSTQLAITSVGNKVIIAGGYLYGMESADNNGPVDYVGVYDTSAQIITNYTLPVPTYSMRSASAGNFAVFAAGFYPENSTSSIASNKAFVFNTATKTWNTATINAFGQNVQSVSIGRFAIFVCGNTADIFDSDTQSWSTHTLIQSAASQFGFTITKTSRYAFIIGKGRADVFDSQTQTWSTLDIEPSTYANYCPSTTVDNYALFVCGDVLAFYDTTTKQFIRRTRPNSVIQAGSVGKLATLFGESNSRLGMQIYDFTTGPDTPNVPVAPGVTSRVITPTPVSVPFSTHQLTSPRPSHYSIANKAVFVNNDDKTVEIYDPETESWSTSSPTSDQRGSVLAAADDFLVFTDKTDASTLHILDVESKSWTTGEVSPHAVKYLQTAGNFMFYSGDNTGPVIAYDIVNNTWIVAASYEGWYEGNQYFVPLKYKSYVIIFRPAIMASFAVAWNTANGLERVSFGYGAGSSRIVPSYGIAGEYFVFAGGVYDNGNAQGFSITNRETGYVYSGNMASARYSLTILYAKPLVMFVGRDLIETFNMETHEWQSSILEVSIPDTRVSVGNRLFFSYDGQTTGVEFDSTTQVWSNISFAGSRVGTVFKLRDVASFVDSDNIVIYDPQDQQHPWTKVQLSVSSGTRLTEAFVVGDKVIVVSSDDLTVRVGDFNQLASPSPTPSPSTPTPTTPQSGTTPTSPSTPQSGTTPTSPSTPQSGATPTSPSTPQSGATPTSPSTPQSGTTPTLPTTPQSGATPTSPTTPQSGATPTSPSTPTTTVPWTAPVSATPVDPVTPSSPSANAPSTTQTPINSDSSPVTVAVPVSGSNLEATSSSSTISVTAIISVIAAVLLIL